MPIGVSGWLGVVGALGTAAQTAKAFSSKPSASGFSSGQTQTLDPAQSQMESFLLQALSKSPSQVFPTYQGDVTTPLSGLQNTSLAALEQGVPGAQGALAGSGKLQGQGQTALGGILTGGPQDLQKYYETNVFAPLNRTFQQTTLPSIASALGGSAGGPQSTAAAKAYSDAGTNFMQQLAATQGQLAFDTGQADIRNKISAAQQVPGMAASPLQSLLSFLTAGGVPTQQDMTNKALQYKQYVDEQARTQAAISDLMGSTFASSSRPNTTVIDPGTPYPSGTSAGQSIADLLKQFNFNFGSSGSNTPSTNFGGVPTYPANSNAF
jgi:hypothetical protein